MDTGGSTDTTNHHPEASPLQLAARRYLTLEGSVQNLPLYEDKEKKIRSAERETLDQRKREIFNSEIVPAFVDAIREKLDHPKNASVPGILDNLAVTKDIAAESEKLEKRKKEDPEAKVSVGIINQLAERAAHQYIDHVKSSQELQSGDRSDSTQRHRRQNPRQESSFQR